MAPNQGEIPYVKGSKNDDSGTHKNIAANFSSLRSIIPRSGHFAREGTYPFEFVGQFQGEFGTRK